MSTRMFKFSLEALQTPGSPDDRDGPEMAKRLLRSETGTLDLAAAFLEADTDKSGTLDKEQFKHVLSVVGIDGADEQQLETIMAMVDLNKDGCADYAEFTDWVTTKMPSMKVKTNQVLHADVHDEDPCMLPCGAPGGDLRGHRGRQKSTS